MNRWLRVCALVALVALGTLVVAGEKATLGDDGRVGFVADSQGTVSIQGTAESRWSPAGVDTPLMPGDMVRTDARGANAAQVRLGSGASIILGPNTLLRVVDAGSVSLLRGEAELSVPDKAEFRIELEQGKTLVAAKGVQMWRVKDGKAELLKKEPNWLAGFKGAITSESLGSLVTNVDGRDVELTIGYHKVTVDIRDQIARTVVEESFVNHTDATLEGVFFFPLPHDASISGFGMWIGDELVEADVVEKQRAREIYETILREKRDPGLLEWSGGNLFKARVYPIFPHSEKRVKVTYTQVLSLSGDSYVYDYALRSELLRRNPLRELNIEVKVNSAVPLAGVQCPSHLAVVEQTQNSAVVKFSAQEYVPQRDFQVRVQAKTDESRVVFIPHRRGEDGYFMLMITPPRTADPGPRPSLPAGEGLDWIVMADTSASMSDAQREARDAFVSGLLSLLGEKDRFNLVACDIAIRTYAAGPVPVSEHHKQAASDWLSAIPALGWTDLDRAFEDVLKLVGPNTRVIYVGDGAHTAHDGDNQALARRLSALKVPAGASFHAVAPGSTFEMAVLEAVSALGDGSLHRLKSAAEAQAVAWELLEQVLRPSLKQVKISFSGFQVARTYPERVASVPDGKQQIVLGRYLPEGGKVSGSVVVEGVYNGKPVSWKARVSFADDEKGNSFIPRLWGRRHMDFLLTQGAGAAIKDDIIDLSERFNIMTPYTSFLVLESDADRIRFGVKKRFRMRDGEKFFAKGRDAATAQLLQAQMQKAGSWRLGMRRSALEGLRTLGRWGYGDVGGAVSHRGRKSGNFKTALRAEVTASLSRDSITRVLMPAASTPMGGAEYRIGLNGKADDGEYLMDESGSEEDRSTWETESAGPVVSGERLDDAEYDMPAEEPAPEMVALEQKKSEAKEMYWDGDNKDMRYAAQAAVPVALGKRKSRAIHADGLIAFGEAAGWGGLGRGPGDQVDLLTRNPAAALDGRYSHLLSWFSNLFPYLPEVPVKVEPAPDTGPVWPPEVMALSESLKRFGDLSDLATALRITSVTESVQVPRKRVSNRSVTQAVFYKSGWAQTQRSDWSFGLVSWCNGKERGIIKPAFGLARQREAVKDECLPAPFWPQMFTFASLRDTYMNYEAGLEKLDGGLVKVKLWVKGPNAYSTHLTIDPVRKVLLKSESWNGDEPAGVTEYSNFHEVAGYWWSGRSETRDKGGNLNGTVTLTWEALDPGQLQKALNRQLEPLEDAIVLVDPLPDLAAARRLLTLKRPPVAAHMVMMMHYALSQRWEKVQEHLDQMRVLLKGRHGLSWLEDAIMQAGRDNQELAGSLLKKGKALDGKSEDELAVAQYLMGQGQSIFQGNEMLEFLDVLKPAFERGAPRTASLKRWMENRIYPLDAVGRTEEAMELRREMAEKFRWDYNAQYQYSWQLSNSGSVSEALDWLNRAVDEWGPWNSWEVEYLQTQVVQILRQQGRFSDVVSYLEKLLQANPESSTLYQQYLSALVFSGRTEEFKKTLREWFKAGEGQDKLSASDTGRLQAAVLQTIGQGYDMYTNVVSLEWLEEINAAARRLALSPAHSYLVGTVLGNWGFSRTESAVQLRQELRQMITSDPGRLTAGQLSQLVSWVWPVATSKKELAAYEPVMLALTKRWENEKNADERYIIGGLVAQALAVLDKPEQRLGFLRKRITEEDARYRDALHSELLWALLGSDWTDSNELEAFGLVEKLGEKAEAIDRFGVQMDALLRITGWMGPARFQAAWSKVEAKAEMSRTQLRDKQKELRQAAYQEVVARLLAQREAMAADFGVWLDLERYALLVELGKELDKVESECLESLAKVNWSVKERWQEYAAGQRLVGVLMYLAVRPGNDGKLADRVLAFLEKQHEGLPEDPTWQDHMFRLLVALDQPERLAKKLAQWGGEKKADPYLKVTEAYLLAEQGRLKDATALFERLDGEGMLGSAEYRTLADWYLVLGQEKARQEALLSQYDAMDEYTLSSHLNMIMSRHRQAASTEGAGPMDPEVPGMFTALFRKSTYPQNYIWQLSDWYRQTKDFRLVGALADGLLGHTPQQVYPVMQGITYLFEAVGDEATVDTINEELDRVLAGAKSDVDRRAVAMLRLAAERRAAEIANQPGPHVKAALKAMKASYKGKWLLGEPRLMCEFLASLGAINRAELKKEQLRQLVQLLKRESKDSPDRAAMTVSLASTLWSYGDMDKAIDLLEAEYRGFRAGSKERLPDAHRTLVTTLASYLQSRSRYGRAERILLDELKLDRAESGQRWWKQQLYNVYVGAVSAQAGTSLGSGAGQFEKAYALMVEDLGSTRDPHYRYAVISTVTSLLRSGFPHHRIKAAALLHLFAWKTVPVLLETQTSNFQAVVSIVGSVLRDLLGAQAGLIYLVERIEKEPEWLRWSQQDGWSYHAYSLGYWKREAGKLGDVERRLLKIVLRELRGDLSTRNARQRQMYHAQYSDFWAEEKEAFAAVAEEMWEKHKGALDGAMHIADYVFSGLDEKGRAADMLTEAYAASVLDDNGRARLVQYLFAVQRYKDAVRPLLELVEAFPQNATYPAQLMEAYCAGGDKKRASALLDSVTKRLKGKQLWGEGSAALLAHACLKCEFLKQAVPLFDEAIIMHQRTMPNRGIGMGTLPQYYGELAQTWSKLHDTEKAVEAACGGVVSWGQDIDSRRGATEGLKQVLRDSGDLADFAAKLEAQVAQTGLENPLVRKTLGMVLAEKQRWDEAVAQLRKSVEVAPQDEDAQRALIDALGQLGDKDGVIRQTLELIAASPRTLSLYQELAGYYTALKQEGEAERAVTSMVEVLPEESESHAALARVRQEQKRWDLAVEQWHHVVRVRTNEPDGWFGLAEAQFKSGDRKGAKATIRHLIKTDWPERFGDVDYRAKELEKSGAKGGD